MFNLRYTVLVLSLISVAYAKWFGHCLNIEAKKNIDSRTIKGNWYVVKSTEKEKCASYMITNDMKAKWSSTSTMWPHFKSSEEYTVQFDHFSPIMTFLKKSLIFFTSTKTVTLRAGEFDSYLIFYNCKEHLFGGYVAESAEVWSRNKEPDSKEVDKLIKSVNIDSSILNSVEQSC